MQAFLTNNVVNWNLMSLTGYRTLIILREFRIMKELEIKVCSRASRALFVSKEDRQNYSKLGGDLKNTVVIPNGVDVEYFCPSSIIHHPSSIIHPFDFPPRPLSLAVERRPSWIRLAKHPKLTCFSNSPPNSCWTPWRAPPGRTARSRA